MLHLSIIFNWSLIKTEWLHRLVDTVQWVLAINTHPCDWHRHASIYIIYKLISTGDSTQYSAMIYMGK